MSTNFIKTPVILNFNDLENETNIKNLCFAWNQIIGKCKPSMTVTDPEFFGVKATLGDKTICLQLKTQNIYVKGIKFEDHLSDSFDPEFSFSSTEESYIGKAHKNINRSYFINCFKRNERAKGAYANDCIRGIAFIISEAARFELIRNVVIKLMTTGAADIGTLSSDKFENIILNWTNILQGDHIAANTMVTEDKLTNSTVATAKAAAATIRGIIEDL